MNRNDWSGGEKNSLPYIQECPAKTKWARHRFASLILVMMLFCLPSAHAQVSASIRGIVTDPSGAPVPAATVTTKNTETGAERSSATDDEVLYKISRLAVEQYELNIFKPSFH